MATRSPTAELDRGTLAVRQLRDLLIAAKRHHSPEAVARLDQTSLLAVRRELLHFSDSRQRLPLFIPGLTAKPWHDPSELAGVGVLEDHFAEIRTEAERLRSPRLKAYRDGGSHPDDGWTSLPLFVDGEPTEEGLKSCPKTVEILRNMPGLGEVAMISALAPQSQIAAHCGPHTMRLIAHLGLIVPEGCFLKVGGEARRWEEGKCLVFDDRFEHEAWNTSNNPRFILRVHIIPPDCSETETEILSEASRLLGRRFLDVFTH